MPDGNGDYLSRFERVEKTLERIASIQEVQSRNITSLFEILQLEARRIDRQDEKLDRHDYKLDRAETLLAEMTEKVNFLIDREIRREGGPDSAR
jgi:Fic family protein